MIIYIRELVRNRTALLIWTLTMVVFSIFLMTFYPTITDQAATLDNLMKQYPAELVQAFNFDRLRMADPMGFYGTEMYIFITLFGSIYAMLIFISVLSREESERTSEFLLTRPVTRSRVITAKALAAFTNITLFNAVFGASNFILFEMYAKGKYDHKILFLLILGPYLMHVFYGSVGLLLSVFVIQARAVYPISIGVVLGTYFLSVVSTLSDSAKNLRYLTPFKYFDAADIVTDRKISPLSLIVLAAVLTSTVLITYVFYNRKDIAA
ncbi:MAG: ABC transporter permease subunit [Eubacteriales bacterium]